ncbi:MAG: chromate transporter [Bryobacteraceae bacterium]|jgi:chromate transporter
MAGVLRQADVRVAQTQEVSLKAFLLYFLRLGTFGFGGPIALAANMRRELVDARQWVSPEDYNEGLAFSQLCPDPLAAQLAMYLGWLRAGVAGATAVGILFILPSFLMVLVLAAVYLRFGSLFWIQGAFYGIGAAVIAIIARGALKLVKGTLGADRLLWVIFFGVTVLTAWLEAELIGVFILCGFLAVLIKAPPSFFSSGTRAQSLVLQVLATGLHGQAALGTLGALFVFFAKAGAFVFGSGLAIIPFLYGGVVKDFHWLTDRQFLDAVAVAMITPGPVVITAAFIGYLVGGPLGSILAAVAVFGPPYFLVIAGAPYYRRVAGNPRVKAFVQGVTAAAVGAITGAAFVLGQRAITDLPTALIATAVLAMLLKTKKVPEPLLIAAAGLAGFLIHGAVGAR